MVWAAISEGVSAGRVLGDGEHEAGSRDGGQEAAAWIQEVHVESQAKTLARGTGRRGQVWEALVSPRDRTGWPRGRASLFSGLSGP